MLCPKVPVFRFIPTRYNATKAINYYDTLGVSHKATQAEIKSAYYKLSKMYHPDISEEKTENLEKFRDISDAYEILGNVSSRKLYDRGLIVTESGTVLREERTSWSPQRSTDIKVPHSANRQTVYDFDAWSKAHYTDARVRRASAKAKYDVYMEKRSNILIRKKSDMLVFALTVFGLTVLSLHFIRVDEDVVLEKEVTEPEKVAV